MEISLKLITVCGIQNITKCSAISQEFVNDLIDLAAVHGTWIRMVNCFVLKYALKEAAYIRSSWYSRKKGIDIRKSIKWDQNSPEKWTFKDD